MGKPRLPRGIQVTYADVSVAVETVGLSGASGAEEKQEECQMEATNRDNILKLVRESSTTVTFRTYWELILQGTEMQEKVRLVSERRR